MKIDLSKANFNKDECEYMKKETEILQEKNPNHIPILIMIKSNVLKIDKQKFLVSNNIVFSDFITNTLKKKLIGLHTDDSLDIYTIKLNSESNQKIESTKINVNSLSIKDIYNEFKDESTNLLILKVSRTTTYKYVKGSVKYWLGY